MKRNHLIYILLFPILAAACLLSLAVGSADLSAPELLAGLFRREGFEVETAIVYAIRLPRLVGAVVAGAGLSLSGMLLQTVMNNPLASPNTIGVNAGAGLFVILCLSVAPSMAGLVPLAAFLGAGITIGLVLLVARFAGGQGAHTVILAGIACTSLFQAGISFFNFLDSDVLVAYNAFSVGGLSNVKMKDLILPAVLVAGGLFLSLCLSGRIAALSLGTAVAASLGVRVTLLRTVCLLTAGLCAAAVVSFAGLLGFVGLVVPHITRRLVGNGIGRGLATAPLVGAILVILSDLAARTLFAPAEIPVGILMAFVGAPFFFVLLLRRGKESSHASN